VFLDTLSDTLQVDREKVAKTGVVESRKAGSWVLGRAIFGGSLSLAVAFPVAAIFGLTWIRRRAKVVDGRSWSGWVGGRSIPEKTERERESGI
jgi:hypothetical protein